VSGFSGGWLLGVVAMTVSHWAHRT
jgi:hypothetical protein